MRKITILLADDDIDDTEMFCEALADINKNIICHCVTNGNEAFKKLDNLEVAPELIFLDLNMPVVNGLDCLKKLKNGTIYKQIPVIIISTSSHKKDMDAAAGLGAICYFVKPNNFNDLKSILELITSNLGNGLTNAIINLQASGSNIFYLEDKGV